MRASYAASEVSLQDAGDGGRTSDQAHDGSVTVLCSQAASSKVHTGKMKGVGGKQHWTKV